MFYLHYNTLKKSSLFVEDVTRDNCRKFLLKILFLYFFSVFFMNILKLRRKAANNKATIVCIPELYVQNTIAVKVYH